jgi:hypothetical protein
MLHMLTLALVLDLHNFAGVPPAIVHDAEREVTRVYQEIGVQVEWDHAPARGSGHTALQIILVAHESGVLRRTRDQIMGAATWTPTGTPVVYVFYRRVEAEAARYSVSVAFVLACALAHELGHVLMPERGRSRDGLMRVLERRRLPARRRASSGFCPLWRSFADGSTNREVRLWAMVDGLARLKPRPTITGGNFRTCLSSAGD